MNFIKKHKKYIGEEVAKKAIEKLNKQDSDKAKENIKEKSNENIEKQLGEKLNENIECNKEKENHKENTKTGNKNSNRQVREPLILQEIKKVQDKSSSTKIQSNEYKLNYHKKSASDLSIFLKVNILHRQDHRLYKVDYIH